jgi:uncharacterized protein YjlB
VLGVGRGSVTLKVGGQSGKQLILYEGDVLILPAGVGHYSVDTSTEYEIVGGYPDGRAWDLLKGTEEGRDMTLVCIKKVPIPFTDPVDGEYGSLVNYW